jgi:hypothetical protein
MTFPCRVAVSSTIGTKYDFVMFGKCFDPKECMGLLLLVSLNLTIKVLWMTLLHGIELAMILEIQLYFR